MNDWWLSLHGLEETAASGEAEGLWLWLGEERFGLDGAAGDSVTLADAAGTTVYADLDGDGIIDHISSVHHDGGYDIFTADPHRAAWGLVAGTPENLPSGGGRTWGLPPNPTPEKGPVVPGENRGKPGWHRIERG